MDTLSKFIWPGSLFLLTLISGVWLTHSGRPLNTAIFTIHKLIALAAVILTGVQIYRLLQGMGTQVLIVVLLLVAGLCVVALFVTGALMSIGSVSTTLQLTVHKIAPLLVTASMAAVIYLLQTQHG